MTSFGFGTHNEMLRIALPTFARYADIHGYDLYVPSRPPSNFSRPASWAKVVFIQALIEWGYDEVLWLDADVVIRRHNRDIAADCGPEPMHMVVHETIDGSVPNCGVWVVRAPAAEFLSQVWSRSGFRREDGWWEQCAVIACLGGDPDAQKVSVPASAMWGQLPYEWNPHVLDARGVPNSARFFHATMIHDRAVTMRRAIGDPT